MLHKIWHALPRSWATVTLRQASWPSVKIVEVSSTWLGHLAKKGRKAYDGKYFASFLQDYLELQPPEHRV